jgi:alpha-amylase
MPPRILLEGFYKRGKYVALPSPADPNDGPDTDWWWDHLAKQANQLAKAGFSAVWLPPVTKAQQGVSEAALGYSVFDDYDIGWKNQKGSRHTRYGDREQITRCAATLRANSLDIYLDLQLNHRKGGAGADEMTFEYLDAFGNPGGGRFPKNTDCFHSRYPANPIPPNFVPAIAQDPDVPDGIGELQEGSKVYFGPDLAHVHAKPAGYVQQNLNAAVQWLSRALDVQGYRLDHVQGISTDYLKQLLELDPLKGSFAVGEYWDGVISDVQNWIEQPQWMNGRCSAFDFPLYFQLLAMSNDPSFNMADLDHAGLAGANPMRAVTFVENHDTESRRDLVPKNIQPEDKPLAYAYILTSEGLPCVFYKDFSKDAGCLGDQLQHVLIDLMWIRNNIADGPTLQRWKDGGVFAYERLGGQHLLVGLNKDKHNGRTIQVATGFPPNTVLHDYTGHATDVRTNAQGGVTLMIPPNASGLGYVCYSVAGINPPPVAPAAIPVTQVFEGAEDLDIKPAQNGVNVQVFRIWAEAATQVTAALTFDATEWAAGTNLTLTVQDPASAVASTQVYTTDNAGTAVILNTGAQGWYTFYLLQQGAPVGVKTSYKLTVTYQAPQVPAI